VAVNVRFLLTVCKEGAGNASLQLADSTFIAGETEGATFSMFSVCLQCKYYYVHCIL
jgi:hypothetical protein